MTDSRDFKRLVRARMAETGESYTTARAHFDPPPKRSGRERSAARATIAAFKKEVYSRRRTSELPRHLERQYGIEITATTELDVGVYRIDRRGAASWVARVFPAARSREATHGDAAILRFLEDRGFPAERVAHEEPVSALAGQPVLVTECAPGTSRRFDESEATMRDLGSMVARLHALTDGPDACRREAGSWHHLSVDGGPRRGDVEVLLQLLDDAETRLAGDERPLIPELRAHLEEIDDLADLPQALIHPDPCSANLVAPDGQRGVLIDWTGAGHGPRLAAFANLVGSVTALALVDAAVDGYRAHGSLEPQELDRLEGALIAFPLILDTWTFLFRDEPLTVLLKRLEVHRDRAAAIASRARAAFAAPSPEPPRRDASEGQASLF